MGKSNHHNHTHCNHGAGVNQNTLLWAVVINVALTVFQLVGGYLADSLSLIADALHNFGDAGALLIAFVAHKIAKLPPDEKMTYGYRRSEILGALVNGTTLVVVAAWLFYSGISKWLQPETAIDAQIVIVVSFVALIIDGITAWLMFSGAKENINMKAAFLHNLMDAMTSFVVMCSGVAILVWGIYKIDSIATLLIAVYIVFHSYGIIKKCILILMQSAPPGLDVKEVKATILSHDFVEKIKHVHVWQLDDKSIFFEAEVFIKSMTLSECERLKNKLKTELKDKFSIGHCTFDMSLQEGSAPCEHS